MVATESQTIFALSKAISIVLTKYESYDMTHIYNKESSYRSTNRLMGPNFEKRDLGIHGPLNRPE